MPRRVQHDGSQPAERDHGVVRQQEVRGERRQALGRQIGEQAGRHGEAGCFRSVDGQRRARMRPDLSCRQHMIVVGMGQHDTLHARGRPLQRAQDAFRVAAGVNDQRASGIVVDGDVAIRAQVPDGDDAQQHGYLPEGCSEEHSAGAGDRQPLADCARGRNRYTPGT